MKKERVFIGELEHMLKTTYPFMIPAEPPGPPPESSEPFEKTHFPRTLCSF